MLYRNSVGFKHFKILKGCFVMTNNPSGIELSWYSKGYDDGMKEANKQTTQVPMAFIKQGGTGYPVLIFNRRFQYESITAKQPDIPLYPHPPKEWHGLSDDEIWDIANFLGKNKEWDYPVMFAKTIEKILREKNT